MLYLQLAGGLLLLVAGGDALVRGAVSIARHLKVSPLLIGLTLVGFGTSTPELVTSVQAAFLGSPGIAIGNVVGSNTANILLILGLAALVRPLVTHPAALRRDGTVALAAAIVCVATVLVGELDRFLGALLVVLLAVYIVHTYRRERLVHDASAAMHEAEAGAADPAPQRLPVAIVFTVGGLILTVFGANLLVEGAIALAAAAGVSESVIGVTVVAVGTSLPELVTSVVAALRRQSDVAFGNIVGSNIYNVFGILGLTAVLQPVPVPDEIAGFDIWVMLAATLLMLGFAITGWRISRSEGAVFLAGYGCYISYLAARNAA